MDSVHDALWRFSIVFYARPGVADACLAVQDRHGKDVNILLYAIWHGLSGRGRLRPDQVVAADRAVAKWRSGTVEPLRALRRRTKGTPGAAELYRALKAAELQAERLVQHRLSAMASPAQVANQAARLADADANLTLYLGPEPAVEAAALRIALRDATESG